MNLPLLLTSPGFVLLCKWTVLLALGWLCHWGLRQQHPRWRLILWRSILCFGLVLPLWQLIEVPGIKIPIKETPLLSSELESPASTGDAAKPTSTAANPTTPVPMRAAIHPPSGTATAPPFRRPVNPISWPKVLVTIWGFGAVLGAMRLTRLQVQLLRLRQESRPAKPELQSLAEQIKARLQVRRAVEIQISEEVTSPFVCGWGRPMVILPGALVPRLSAQEASALLSHELAHLRKNDLAWSVAWRWMQAACWFHPLVWAIPSAHNLACEQEADRIASGQLTDQQAYARLLAQLALRVLALPAVETQLSLNGSSQIARRLNHLGRKGKDNWNWKQAAAAGTFAGLIFALVAGCQFSKSSPSAGSGRPPVEFKKVLVVVQDEDGKPIEGATILPNGFRVKGLHGADAYHWGPTKFGEPPAKVITDQAGKAYVKYPVVGIPEEKELTGKIMFSVTHPDYASVNLQEYSVDSPEEPIRLARGIHLEVSGYYGQDHQSVPELVPNLSEEGLHQDDWQKKDNGALFIHQLSPGGHTLQLMGHLASGTIVYSEGMDFVAERGKAYHFTLEMKPGIRLEGRLDDQVPRPVKNGRVVISVRPKEFPALLVPEDYGKICEQYGYFHFWKTYRPINEVGTFVFESVPPGEVDVVVHGDGFASKSIGQVKNRINSVLVNGPKIGIPQPFPLVSPVTKIEVVTEPTATLEIRTTTRSGKPIAGATIYVNPNILRMQTGLFGEARVSNEEPFHTPLTLPRMAYSATTDKNGMAVIPNIPPATRGLEVSHPQYQVPIQQPKGWHDRHIRTDFASGKTNHLDLVLEPIGADFLGSR